MQEIQAIGEWKMKEGEGKDWKGNGKDFSTSSPSLPPPVQKPRTTAFRQRHTNDVGSLLLESRRPLNFFFCLIHKESPSSPANMCDFRGSLASPTMLAMSQDAQSPNCGPRERDWTSTLKFCTQNLSDSFSKPNRRNPLHSSSWLFLTTCRWRMKSTLMNARGRGPVLKTQRRNFN